MVCGPRDCELAACMLLYTHCTRSSALFVDVSSYSNTRMVPEQGASECFRAMGGRMRVACRDWMSFLSLKKRWEVNWCLSLLDRHSWLTANDASEVLLHNVFFLLASMPRLAWNVFACDRIVCPDRRTSCLGKPQQRHWPGGGFNKNSITSTYPGLLLLLKAASSPTTRLQHARVVTAFEHRAGISLPAFLSSPSFRAPLILCLVPALALLVRNASIELIGCRFSSPNAQQHSRSHSTLAPTSAPTRREATHSDCAIQVALASHPLAFWRIADRHQ
jgi:hypothetical protein